MEERDAIVDTPHWFANAVRKAQEVIDGVTPRWVEEIESPCSRFRVEIAWFTLKMLENEFSLKLYDDETIVATFAGVAIFKWRCWLTIKGEVYLLFPLLPSCPCLLCCRTGEISVFLDAEDLYAPSFCWMDANANPADAAKVVVQGSYSVGLPDIRIVDFSDPEAPKIIWRIAAGGTDLIGWISGDVIRVEDDEEMIDVNVTQASSEEISAEVSPLLRFRTAE